ncbi:RidA family protein [Pigmentiphaga sp.]|uniref:RidA family protein n=1 Tax=Pigmentiphaga sp. TaxID=1977564 RepID=UPI00128B0C34|nr:RidA family protein [Pigmentiphaga sp.]MPS28461.1 RidA family protein [Alcaligenaceae bacterium SAGV5]MPS52126.1 RidA family protein [Alcaligenaceae bacterium SAGV3]MPT56282.1 RidA family protein [Alcaligenaceae bacterium]
MTPWPTPRLPAPVGHYVAAMQTGQLVYLSGVLPDLARGEDFATQFDTCFDRIETILAEGGQGLASIVQCTIYLSDIGLWDEFNQLYRRRLGQHRCARTVVPVGPLHFGAQIEVQVVAEATRSAAA